ncbi:hypothetical protein ACUY1T_19315 [Billgrantia sp. Q4P2]|uniref:hypothetical protein n=1 Tax=Billgrantia sp. Q4P2 TaxID=3463857 RepID=UPI0040572BE6
MKQWIVVFFVLVIMTGEVLADTSVMPRSGVYAVTSIEPLEASPLVDMILPDIEESMGRAWIRYNRQTGHADIYMEGQKEPLHFNFDFDSRLATGPDQPSAELRPNSSEQFLLINGTPFEIAFTFQRIDEDGPEFTALQSSREEFLESKQLAIEDRESGLSELFNVEPLSINASNPVDWSLPYIFDRPVDWNVTDITFTNTDTIASEGLIVSTDFGAPGLVIGQLLTDADAFRESVISPDDSQETIHLEAPERSLTIIMDQNGNLGLLGLVPSGQDETNFWAVEPDSFWDQRNIQTLIAMFYTIRRRDSQEESHSFTDPDTWPQYRLTEESEQMLKERIKDIFSLEGLLGLMGGQVRVTLFDDDRRRSDPVFSLTLVDAEPEPLSPMPPLVGLGNPDEGQISLWEDGSSTQCTASLSLPILSRERETVAYLRIAEYVNHHGYQGPDYSQYGYCITAWSALQTFKSTFEDDLVTDLPTLARVLGSSEGAYLRDGYLVVVQKVGDDLLRGLLSQEGETILPTQYKKIDIHSDRIVAEDSFGKWEFPREGEMLVEP